MTDPNPTPTPVAEPDFEERHQVAIDKLRDELMSCFGEKSAPWFAMKDLDDAIMGGLVKTVLDNLPKPPDEPAIVQRMRDVCAVQRNEYGHVVLSTEIGKMPQGTLGTLDECRALLSHLDRLASGTGEPHRHFDSLVEQRNKAEGKYERARTRLIELHDLLCRPGQPADHDFAGCAIDRVISDQEHRYDLEQEHDSLRSELATSESMVREITNWMASLITSIGGTVALPDPGEKPGVPRGFMAVIEEAALRAKPADAPTTGIAGLLSEARRDLATAKEQTALAEQREAEARRTIEQWRNEANDNADAVERNRQERELQRRRADKAEAALSALDGIKADLATAKRELEEAKRNADWLRTELVARDAQLESARSQPVVPTGERPSDDYLVRVYAGACERDLSNAEVARANGRRALFEAGVARGEAKAEERARELKRGRWCTVCGIYTTGKSCPDHPGDAGTSSEPDIQPAEPKADPPGYTDGTHGSIPKMGPRDEEPKAEPVCGRCALCTHDAHDGHGCAYGPVHDGFGGCDCGWPKEGSGKQEQATTGPHQHAFTIACFTDGIGSPIVHALKCKCGAIQERYPRPSGSFVEAPNPFDPAVVAGVRVWEDDVHPHPMRCDRCGESNFVLVEQPELRDAAIRFLIRCATCGDHPGAGSLAFSVPAEPTDEVPPGKVVVKEAGRSIERLTREELSCMTCGHGDSDHSGSGKCLAPVGYRCDCYQFVAPPPGLASAEKEGGEDVVAKVLKVARAAIAAPYYNPKTKDDAGSDWLGALEDIVELLDGESADRRAR